MTYTIAIDGPAGAGKSTVAKKLADRLGFDYLDTGAMYRAVTLEVLRRGHDPKDRYAVQEVASDIKISFHNGHVHINDDDVDAMLRMPMVTKSVSLVSSYRFVRECLVTQQQRIADESNIVVDGRDIGTVVLPQATIKFFLTASAEERAWRRIRDEKNTAKMTYDEILEDIQERDRFDSEREESPLRQAEDAILIDSTEMNIDQVVDRMEEEFRRVAK